MCENTDMSSSDDLADGHTTVNIIPTHPQTSFNAQSNDLVRDCRLKNLKRKAAVLFISLFAIIVVCFQLASALGNSTAKTVLASDLLALNYSLKY